MDPNVVMLENVTRVLEILSIAITLTAFFAGVRWGPKLYMEARKYFAETKDTVSPVQLADRLEQNRHAIVTEVNTIVGRLEVNAMQKHEQLIKNMDDVRDAAVEAIRKANDAHDKAKDAIAQNDVLDERVTGMTQLVEAELRHLTRAVENLEQRRRRPA